jgi:hypothetical protein
MPFRNPLYLDTELLANLSDYFGIALPEEKNVTRRSLEAGTKGGGVDKVVVLKGEASHAEEVTETYSVSTRPVRLMNDLIDHVEASEELVDLDADPEATVVNGAVVLVRGDMAPSAANDIGGIMARFLPLLMSMVSQGATEFEPTQAELAQAFMTEPAGDTPQLFDISEENPVEGRRILLIVDPIGLRGSATLDDLEGDQTVVAHVDRIVRPRQDLSLDKYLLPGLPRALRRALGHEQIAGMVSGLDAVVGRKIEPGELTLQGPALLLKPLAVF